MNREEQIVANALCTCSLPYGKHAAACSTHRLTTNTLMARAFTDALTAHDRRLLAASEPFCVACGISLRDTDRTVVDGNHYCLTDCPTRPQRTP